MKTYTCSQCKTPCKVEAKTEPPGCIYFNNVKAEWEEVKNDE
jgi:hypothetical protein